MIQDATQSGEPPIDRPPAAEQLDAQASGPEHEGEGGASRSPATPDADQASASSSIAAPGGSGEAAPSGQMAEPDGGETAEQAISADAANEEVDLDDTDDDDTEDDDADDRDVKPLEEVVYGEDDEGNNKEWYILKVQSNREKSICDGLKRRVAIAGLDRFFGDVIVPTEDVAEFKNGKRRIVKRKLYPGYIVINMVINEETWFLVRETPGIGDFTGSAGKPTPMLEHEIDRIIRSGRSDDDGGEPIKTAIPFKQGDRVRIKEGTFENFEGDVEGIDEANGRVTVMINIFGRSTPVELEHWQVDAV